MQAAECMRRQPLACLLLGLLVVSLLAFVVTESRAGVVGGLVASPSVASDAGVEPVLCVHVFAFNRPQDFDRVREGSLDERGRGRALFLAFCRSVFLTSRRVTSCGARSCARRRRLGCAWS